MLFAQGVLLLCSVHNQVMLMDEAVRARPSQPLT